MIYQSIVVAAIGEMRCMGNGDGLHPGAIYCEMGTHAYEEVTITVGTQPTAQAETD
jgi:hypothetical protein